MGIQELEWERAWQAASRIELVLYCDSVMSNQNRRRRRRRHMVAWV